jgi:lipid II:glycine glycyltransferase (peptidoglycan interpeptide bridge formation enzyme)
MSSSATLPLLPPPPALLPLALPLTVTVTDRPTASALADWSRLVAESIGGDVAQLPEWARLRGTVGFRARYILVHAGGPGGELLGGAQVLERPLPLLGSVGYVPYGPVVAEGLSDPSAVRAALSDALTELGRTAMRMLFVQPPAGGEAVSRELLARGFRPSDANIAPGQTLRLYLHHDIGELRAGLSRRLRTWTNRWESRGVTVRLGTEADVPLLAALVARSGEHQGFAAVTADYLGTLVRELGPSAVIFVGELDGRPVAAALFTRYADSLKLRFAGMDRDEAVSRSNVPAAVQWYAIQWAKRAGLRWFDQGGISAESADALFTGQSRDSLRGVDRFKASFGGEPHRSPPAIELIANPVLRAGYDLSRDWAPGRRLIELAKAVLRTGRLR